MKRFRWMILAVLLILTALTSRVPAQEAADILISAEKAGQRIPLLSPLYPAMDVAMASEIQASYVQKRLGHDRLAGFKAGLTAVPAQQRFGVPGPVAGVLFASGRLKSGATVAKSDYHLPMIETEIGFIMGVAADQPFTDTDAIKAAVREVVPVIELPDLGFADMKTLKGVDIIAANVSARKFVAGQPLARKDRDLNQVAVTLTRNGSPVNEGKGSDALGDQWQALRWLANTMINQGYALAPGQVLITGALGKMVPGESGQYVAEYGELGRIEFQIR